MRQVHGSERAVDGSGIGPTTTLPAYDIVTAMNAAAAGGSWYPTSANLHDGVRKWLKELKKENPRSRSVSLPVRHDGAIVCLCP